MYVQLWGAECLSHVGPFLLPALLECSIDPCPVQQLQQQQQQQQQQGGAMLLQEEQTEAIAGEETLERETEAIKGDSCCCLF